MAAAKEAASNAAYQHCSTPRIGKSKSSVWASPITPSPNGRPYWDESAYWEFTSGEVDRLEAATAEIQRLALAAGEHILDRNRFAEMHIPAAAVERIRETWRSEPPALYGRLDLAYDGRQIKLLEYNADTPTALIEAAVAQWYWLEDRFPGADQFNSLHEKLVAKWKDLVPYLAQPVYFGHDESEEDHMTISYLRDTAQQAGLRTFPIPMHEIGWESAKSRFVDQGRQPVRTIFKLYPWEWLLAEEFGMHAIETMNPGQSESDQASVVQWIEPIWKMLWSNKALLAILWELNPNHELLLPAYLDSPRNLKDYVRKPLFGREGSGITVFRNWAEAEKNPATRRRKPGDGAVCLPEARISGRGRRKHGCARKLAHRWRASRNGHSRIIRPDHHQYQPLRAPLVSSLKAETNPDLQLLLIARREISLAGAHCVLAVEAEEIDSSERSVGLEVGWTIRQRILAPQLFGNVAKSVGDVFELLRIKRNAARRGGDLVQHIVAAASRRAGVGADRVDDRLRALAHLDRVVEIGAALVVVSVRDQHEAFRTGSRPRVESSILSWHAVYTASKSAVPPPGRSRADPGFQLVEIVGPVLLQFRSDIEAHDESLVASSGRSSCSRNSVVACCSN